MRGTITTQSPGMNCSSSSSRGVIGTAAAALTSAMSVSFRASLSAPGTLAALMELVTLEFAREAVTLVATPGESVSVLATDPSQSSCLDACFPHAKKADGLFADFETPGADRPTRISFRPELLVKALKHHVKKSDEVELVQYREVPADPPPAEHQPSDTPFTYARRRRNGNNANANNNNKNNGEIGSKKRRTAGTAAVSPGYLYVYVHRSTTTATKTSTHQIPLLEVLDGSGEELRIDPAQFHFTHQVFTEHAAVLVDILGELRHADVEDVAVTLDRTSVTFAGVGESHFNALTVRLEDLNASCEDGASGTIQVLCDESGGKPHTERFRRKFLHRLGMLGGSMTSLLLQLGPGCPLSAIATLEGGGTCQLFVAPMLPEHANDAADPPYAAG